MNILFLTPRLPYPAISGGLIKTSRLLENLSEDNSVTLACFVDEESHEHIQSFRNNSKIVNYYTEHLSRPRSAYNFLKSILCKKPLSVYRNFSKTFQKEIEKKSNNYDLIFVDHFLMFQYVPKGFKGKVVLHQHNAEYVMWKRYSQVESNFVKKGILKFETGRIKKYEASICIKSHSVLASPNDIEKLVAIGAKKDKFYETLHLGDEEQLKLPKLSFENTKQTVLYIGTMSWEANKDGLLWFLRNVWPSVKRNSSNTELVLVGKNPPAELVDIVSRDQTIVLKGFIDDLESLYLTSRVFIAPLRFGSGIKVKVVNAMYRGIPTVTTSVGAEGLKVVSGDELIVTDCESDMSSSICELLSSKSKWERLRDCSLEFATRELSWKSVFDNVRRAVDVDN